ncbi:hypothetical protein Franean1_6783 [Parafrankia sp. EAN1pec]|nr:hypothetical protein Franean1_6783 [Frankia sp. EAN1pec]
MGARLTRILASAGLAVLAAIGVLTVGSGVAARAASPGWLWIPKVDSCVATSNGSAGSSITLSWKGRTNCPTGDLFNFSATLHQLGAPDVLLYAVQSEASTATFKLPALVDEIHYNIEVWGISYRYWDDGSGQYYQLAGGYAGLFYPDPDGDGCAYSPAVANPTNCQGPTPSPSPTRSPSPTPSPTPPTSPSPTPKPTPTAPAVSAGADRTVAGQRSVTLAGKVSGASATAWTQLAGPGQVTFSAGSANAVATFSTLGTYALRLTAVSPTGLSAHDDVTIRIVDHYRVELKSWIPQSSTADPFVLAPVSFPNPYIPLMGQPLRSCFAAVSSGSPNGSVRVVSSEFAGDGHRVYGVTGPANDTGRASDVRIITTAELDWDGKALTGLSAKLGVGTTTRTFTIVGDTGKRATCRLVGHADPSVNPGAKISSPATLTIGVKGSDPLTPTSAAPMLQAVKDICQSALPGPASLKAICAVPTSWTSTIPITPSLDGAITATPTSTGLRVTYTTDRFPSYGIAVRRNSETSATAVITDASCMPGTGYDGAATVLAGLQTVIGDKATGTLNLPYTSSVCRQLPAAVTAPIAASLRVGINTLTEPVLILAASRVPQS